MDGETHRVQFLDENDVQIRVDDPVIGTFLTNTPILFDRIVEKFTATEGQTIFDLANAYTPGNNELQVYIGGILQSTPENYTETSTTRITFTVGLEAGDFVVVTNFRNLNTVIQVEKQNATAGQTLFTLSSIVYQPFSGKLLVFINGVFQTTPENYAESSTTTVTFTAGLDAGDFVVFINF